MGFEIEQKYRTDDHRAVADRLAALRAEPGPTATQEDAYLRHPARDFAQTGEALRLRRSGDWNAVTYKGPKRPGPAKTREELEIPFAEGPRPHDEMLRLIEALGFGTFAVIQKERTPYHLTYQGREVEVTLDRVDGLGTFVEVETLAEDDSDLPRAQEVVTALGADLGLTEVEPRSYLRLNLEHRGLIAPTPPPGQP